MSRVIVHAPNGLARLTVDFKRYPGDDTRKGILTVCRIGFYVFEEKANKLVWKGQRCSGAAQQNLTDKFDMLEGEKLALARALDSNTFTTYDAKIFSPAMTRKKIRHLIWLRYWEARGVNNKNRLANVRFLPSGEKNFKADVIQARTWINSYIALTRMGDCGRMQSKEMAMFYSAKENDEQAALEAHSLIDWCILKAHQHLSNVYRKDDQ